MYYFFNAQRVGFLFPYWVFALNPLSRTSSRHAVLAIISQTLLSRWYLDLNVVDIVWDLCLYRSKMNKEQLIISIYYVDKIKEIKYLFFFFFC